MLKKEQIAMLSDNKVIEIFYMIEMSETFLYQLYMQALQASFSQNRIL